jgi:hypothetical protein
MVVAFTLPPYEVKKEVIADDSPAHSRPTPCERVAIVWWLLGHSIASWCQPTFEGALHMVFHTVVIAGGLVGSAFFTRDVSIWRTACAFILLEAFAGIFVGTRMDDLLLIMLGVSDSLILGMLLWKHDTMNVLATPRSLFNARSENLSYTNNG